MKANTGTESPKQAKQGHVKATKTQLTSKGRPGRPPFSFGGQRSGAVYSIWLAWIPPFVGKAPGRQTALQIVAVFLTAVFPILVTVAACYDLLTMQIPNRFPAALAIAFLALALLGGLPMATIGLHFVAGIGLLLGTFALFAFGFLGGGDAKLASAIALWFGIEHLLPFLALTALFGGALSLVILGFRMMPLPAPLLGWAPASRLHQKGAGVPYGVALAASALMVFPDTHWFAAFASF